MNRDYRQISNGLSLDQLSLDGGVDNVEGGGQTCMSGKPLSSIRLLIFTSNVSFAEALTRIACGMGLNSVQATGEVSQQRILQLDIPDIIFVDAPGPCPFELKHLLCLRTTFPKARIVIATPQGSIPPKIGLSNFQPCNYLRWPFGPNELRVVLASCCKCWVADSENRVLSARQRTLRGLGNIIGKSPAMEKLYRLIRRSAFSRFPVLIVGEAGTGKELVAHTIHWSGPHAHKTFISIDCKGVDHLLFDSLFARSNPSLSAFNDSIFGSTSGGTLFLDNIDALPIHQQTRLIRAMQDQDTCVSQPHRAPFVRLIAATQQDIVELVARGLFRSDLCIRLEATEIRVPPLRVRKGDIGLLTEYFLSRVRALKGRLRISAPALRLMQEYDWPGNVEELRLLLETISAKRKSSVLRISDLPATLTGAAKQRSGHNDRHHGQTRITIANHGPLRPITPIREVNKQVILDALRQLGGDKTTAATVLGIGKSTLYRKIKEYGID